MNIKLKEILMNDNRIGRKSLEAFLEDMDKVDPCEYCKSLRNNKSIIGNDVFITGENVLLANTEIGYQKAYINFCPMCGRELIKSK